VRRQWIPAFAGMTGVNGQNIRLDHFSPEGAQSAT
jgi:hypothetical protein